MITSDRERVHREVVSFVRRSARMRPNQREAWDRLHDRFVVEVPRLQTSTSVAPAATLDLTAVFGRDAPLVVEVGPGTGDSLVPMAWALPTANILAFEVYQPAIAQILAALERDAVENVRILEADAVAGLEHVVPTGVIDDLWTFFPDPWHKLRHHKRRLVTPAFASLAASRLAPGAVWRLATDWSGYAEQMVEVLDAVPLLTGGVVPRWSERPVTKFERKGLAAGRVITDLRYLAVPS